MTSPTDKLLPCRDGVIMGNELIDRKIFRLRVGLKLNLPSLPNYIRGTDDACYDIAAFDEAQLTEIGARWTEALIEKAKRRAL